MKRSPLHRPDRTDGPRYHQQAPEAARKGKLGGPNLPFSPLRQCFCLRALKSRLRGNPAGHEHSYGRIVAMRRRGRRQRTRHLMPPQRSVVPDTKLSQGAGGEPARVPLAGSGKLDDPQRDSFSYLVSGAGGKLKAGADSAKCLVHGFNLLGLESESTGSGSWHGGAIDALNGHAPDRRHATADCSQMCDRHEELNPRRPPRPLGCFQRRR